MADADNALFARESLAGYDRACLERAVVTIVGCGAAGSNVAQNLALSGVNELRCIDPDVVEVSNLTRSPFFDRRRLDGRRKPHKAREVALGALAVSYAQDPIVRYATAMVEEVGRGALAGSSVVVCAVDSLACRALLADETRLLGIPLVELGFSGHRGHVSVFRNGHADQSCWRCAHPLVSDGRGFSCTKYARLVSESGRVPATQPLASFFGALAAELAIQAAHRRFPAPDAIVHFDIHDGRGRRSEVTRDDGCPGIHETFGEARELGVGADDTVDDLLGAAARLVRDPVIELPAPFVVDGPCSHCGAPVRVAKPAWAVREPPSCRACPDIPQLSGGGAVTLTSVAAKDGLGRLRARDIGLGPLAVFAVRSGSRGDAVAVRLAGSLDDLLVTRRRARNAADAPGMKVAEAANDAD